VESPVDSAMIPDGAPLSAYQYFENVRNFLVAVEEIGIPTFEASDLEQVCNYQLLDTYYYYDIQLLITNMNHCKFSC
jgi:hypothetical protein